MILGLLFKAKKKRTLTLQHLTEAKRITSQFGPSLKLTKIDAALAELTRSRGGSCPSIHSKRREIKVEDRLLLHPLVAVLFADRHDLAHDFHIEAVGLGLAVDVLDVVGQRLLLLLEPLDPLDEGAQMAGVDLFRSGRDLVLLRRLGHSDSSLAHGRRGGGLKRLAASRAAAAACGRRPGRAAFLLRKFLARLALMFYICSHVEDHRVGFSLGPLQLHRFDPRDGGAEEREGEAAPTGSDKRRKAIIPNLRDPDNSASSIRIAVGTPITERPPHRSVCAAFPHTAPTSGV